MGGSLQGQEGGGVKEGVFANVWDSGICLDRGLLDNGNVDYLVLLDKFVDSGGCRNCRNAHGSSTTMHASPSSKIRSRAESIESLSLAGDEAEQDRDECRHHNKSDNGAGALEHMSGTEGDKLSAIVRVGVAAASDHNPIHSKFIALPRVKFSPEPIPPEMDPTRPPIEIGSWKPALPPGGGSTVGAGQSQRRGDSETL